MLRLKTILQYNSLYLILLLIIITISFIRCNIPSNSIYNLNTKLVEGKVTEYKIDGSKMTFIVNGKEKVRCTYYIKSLDEKLKLEELDLGVILKVTGELSIPKNNTIPNTFNYKEYLEHNNIKYVMNVDKLEVINNKTNFLYKLKNILTDYLETFKSKEYLFMFIMGNKNYLSDGVYEQYQELGVSHIFAISGMHVSLLTAILLKILSKINIKENISYPIIIIFLIFYSFITNFQASILRSVGLFILLYINKRLDLNIKTINILFLDISILLLINPQLLYNLGFIYSSVVSFSLIKYSHLIKGNYLMTTIKVSTIAFLFSLPITLYSSYEINILTVFNNLVIVPLISTFIYPMSLLTLIFNPLDNVFYEALKIIENISKILPVINIVVPKINIIFIVIYYLVLFIFFESFNKKILLIIPLMIVIVKLAVILDPNYYVYFLDIGQGDSTVIKYKDNTILIDTGGTISYKKEEWEVSKEYYKTDNTITFLKSIGVSKLDYLILTHGDYDHMGEAINLVENFKVEKVIFNCGEFNELEQNLINVLDKKKIPYYSCIKELNIDNNQLYFLNNKDYKNENDNSSVIYTELKNHKFLFMGDAGVEVEEDLTEKYNLKNIDVLKVGHHGSKTSSSKYFINEINPKYSIISVGKNNRYGHPNKEVLNNLKDVKIYRTDQDGSIMFKIKNNKLKIETCAP